MAIIKIGNPAIDLDAAEIPNLDTSKITTGQFTDSRIADVASAKITGTITPSDSTVSLAKLTATGTKDATTFLRGDNTFAEAGGGKVLQVVTATDSGERATTSTSFVTASNTLTVNITPSSTSSKIFLNATGAFGGGVGFMYTTIFRGATDLGYSSEGITQYNNSDGRIIPFAMSILDSPNSTSQQTYQVYFRRYDSNSTSILAATKKTITAFEIGA